jgi:hypothetical protein
MAMRIRGQSVGQIALISRGVLNRANEEDPVSVLPVNRKLAESMIATSSFIYGICVKERTGELKIMEVDAICKIMWKMRRLN